MGPNPAVHIRARTLLGQVSTVTHGTHTQFQDPTFALQNKVIKTFSLLLNDEVG